MYLQNVPNTSNYMILGYALALITMGLYVASMYIRNRNLKRDLETLQSLEADQAKKK
ncbi:MAG: hypothetical protein U0Z26_10595 [Anaerolineales bacterium]